MNHYNFSASTPISPIGPIGERYRDLASYRETTLARGRNCAELTIPRLLPPAGAGDQTTMVLPYQSLGARGCQYLAGKLTTALLPPGNAGVFTLALNHETLTADGVDASGAEKNALIGLEELVHMRINASTIRSSLSDSLLHSIITGNCCIFLDRGMKSRVYRIDQFVCLRQPDGTIMETITHDRVDVKTLPDRLKQTTEIQKKMQSKDPGDRLVDLYTQCIRSSMYDADHPAEANVPGDTNGKDGWVVVQEVHGQDTGMVHRYNHSPFIVPRWSASTGEHYGRGMVEAYLGDLRTYEGLNQAILEASAAMSRVVFMIRAGAAHRKDLAEAENGEFVEVRDPEGVVALTADLRVQLAVSQQHAADVERRLQAAFLMSSALQRDAERVTATEIRAMMAELESALGGVYTTLSQELMQPLIQMVIEYMADEGELPEGSDRYLKADVLTGFSALGREQELQRIQGFVQSIAPLGDTALQRVNVQEVAERTARAWGLNPEGLMIPEETFQQRTLQQNAATAATGGLGNIAEALVTDGIAPVQ